MREGAILKVEVGWRERRGSNNEELIKLAPRR